MDEMIIIAGRPGSIPTEQLSPLEGNIYKEKQSSRVPYMYDSEDQLRFELRVRAGIVNASQEMVHSKAEFASFSKSRANPYYWIREENGGFRQRQGTLASDGIRDIFINSQLYAFECATAIIILMYKAVLETIGDEAFNRNFKNLLLYAWNYDEDLRIITRPEGEIFQGDVLYFKNPQVNPETPEWQGENVVVMADHSFFGHGMGIRDERGIIDGLNSNRRPNAYRSAYMLKQVTQPDFKYIYQVRNNYPDGIEVTEYRYDSYIVTKIGEITSVWA